MRAGLTRFGWFLGLASLGGAGTAHATGCFPLAQKFPEIQVASLDVAGLDWVALSGDATVRLSFLGHSSYLIEVKDGTLAVTDYNGMKLERLPDIVTMNNAHSTHYTPFPDPGITHVLRGWGENNTMAVHDVSQGDLRVRNIPTSVHGRTGTQTNSNSIFVFEVEDLCLAHLGHLHHLLEDEHLGELGIIDIVMVPIDGAYTMSQAQMTQVIDQIDPAVVLPMHYFGQEMIARFMALLGDDWELVVSDEPSAEFSRLTLPNRRVLLLPQTRG